MHQQSLANNIINNKMREDMYNKHLREVNRIQQREAQGLKKELRAYHSITDLHKKNKNKSLLFSAREHERQLQLRNARIYKKIQAMKSQLSARGRESTFQKYNMDLSQPKESRVEETVQKVEITQKSKDSFHGESLHSKYRKRRQEQIELENKKLMKALATIKSTLPHIKNRSRGNKSESAFDHYSKVTKGSNDNK